MRPRGLPALLALAACAQNRPPMPADDAPAAAFNRTVMPCRAEAVADLVGKPVTAALLADARTRARVRQVRTIAPGDLVTIDYRGDRLNVERDASGRVARVRCG